MFILESLVKEHFPLLTDRFNYVLGRPKGISAGMDANNLQTYLKVGNLSKYNYKHTTYKYKNLEDAYLVFSNWTIANVFCGYEITANMLMIIRISFDNFRNDIDEKIKENEKYLACICEYTHALIKNPREGDARIRRLFEKGSLSNVLYIVYNNITDKWVCTIKLNIIEIKESVIKSLMLEYENKFILNSKQRETILSTLKNLSKKNSLSTEKHLLCV